MSALTWDDVVVDGTSARKGAHALGPARDVRMSSARHLHLVPAPSGAADMGASSLSLTRRGRLAMTVGVALAFVAAIIIGMSFATAAPAPIASVAGPSVTVAAGETLSGIAARELPDLSIREGIARIQVINNLSTTAISAGQVLVIPAN